MNPHRRSRTCLAVLAPFVLASALSAQGQLASRMPLIEGNRRVGQPQTLSFATQVVTDESLHPPGQNPFLDYRFQVAFEHKASGTRRLVPGFYAADGDAAESGATGGSVWRAHFTPDHAGLWTWKARFRRAPGIALDASIAGVAADPAVDRGAGFFEALPADPSAPGFLGKGMLLHADDAYFRFVESGEWFLKSGMGGPENFLAYFEFDGTLGNPADPCLPGPDRLHHFASHAADFVEDEIGAAHLWGGGTQGHNILGALDYLASVGVNSLYFITNSYFGDGHDVWPWVQASDKLRFDVSKLAQWEKVFSYMDHRGLKLQLVFEEQENDQLAVGSGGLGYGLTAERRLYYREMVARFAHHPALQWVIGDESNYWDEIDTMKTMAAELRGLDPYDHPLTFHGKHPCGGCPVSIPSVLLQYQPYFDSDDFDSSAFQGVPGGYHVSAVELRAAQTSSRKWAHYGDEQSLNATGPNLDQNRTKALWGSLMGGGAGIAWYPGNSNQSQYPPGELYCDYYDLGLEDLRRFEAYFQQTAIALALFHGELPFTEMVTNDSLAAPNGATDYVFHRAENAGLGVKAVYAVYRGTGSATDLTLGSGSHTLDWFNPRTGEGPLAAAPLVGPGPVTLSPPSQDPGMDWLAIVRQE